MVVFLHYHRVLFRTTKYIPNKNTPNSFEVFLLLCTRVEISLALRFGGLFRKPSGFRILSSVGETLRFHPSLVRFQVFVYPNKISPDVTLGDILFVHSRGIEPRLPAPQASVLSIKRRVRTKITKQTIPRYYQKVKDYFCYKY